MRNLIPLFGVGSTVEGRLLLILNYFTVTLIQTLTIEVDHNASMGLNLVPLLRGPDILFGVDIDLIVDERLLFRDLDIVIELLGDEGLKLQWI